MRRIPQFDLSHAEKLLIKQADEDKAAEKKKRKLQTARYAKTIDAIKRWEKRERRVKNALRKLRTRKRYYEKHGLA